MITPKDEAAFNSQINKELYSSYLYLSMNAWFLRENLMGFANWMKVQAQEENLHAQLLYAYLYERGGKIDLQAIAKPPADWKSSTEAFVQVLEHEQFVTASIHALAETSEKAKDRSAVGFLDWFIKEQVEEEKNASRILGQLKLFGEVPQAVYMLDQELKARVFALPADIPITPV